MELKDKSALVAEIERIRRIEVTNNDVAYNGALDEIRYFLDTLEVKEVDLEKETKKWWKEHLHLDPKNQLWMDAHQSIVFAEHFFKLGMAVSNKTLKRK